MPRKPAKKRPARKTRKPVSFSRAKKKKPRRKTASRKPRARPRRTRLRKSAARRVIRRAVARRSLKKSPKRKTSRPRPRSPRRSSAGKSSRRAPAERTGKKPLRKKAHVSRASPRKRELKKRPPRQKKHAPKKPVPASQLDGDAAPRAAKSKAERLGGELNRAEILEMLSDRYTRHLVIESGGEYALEIIRGFSNNSSDEDMAKKLKIKISDVRATLNKLHSLGIVDYIRYKDSETGWFSYYWFLDTGRMKEWVNKRVAEDHRRMDFSNGEHYYCPACGGASIHDFVSASDFGFKCPSCSASLDYLSEDKANELFPMRSFRKPLL